MIHRLNESNGNYKLPSKYDDDTIKLSDDPKDYENYKKVAKAENEYPHPEYLSLLPEEQSGANILQYVLFQGPARDYGIDDKGVYLRGEILDAESYDNIDFVSTPVAMKKATKIYNEFTKKYREAKNESYIEESSNPAGKSLLPGALFITDSIDYTDLKTVIRNYTNRVSQDPEGYDLSGYSVYELDSAETGVSYSVMGPRGYANKLEYRLSKITPEVIAKKGRRSFRKSRSMGLPLGTYVKGGSKGIRVEWVDRIRSGQDILEVWLVDNLIPGVPAYFLLPYPY